MFRLDEVSTSVTLGVKVSEPVDAFWRRALMEAADDDVVVLPSSAE